MRARRSGTLLAVLLAASLPAAPARAGDEPVQPAAGAARPADDAAKLAQVSDFFDAGAQAYKAGQYLVAGEAFMKAHALLPSPSLLFSAAQAYRKQCLVAPTPELVRRAIGLYRDYLRSDPSAKRREDAVQALEALVALEARLAPREGEAPKEPADAGGGERAGGTRLLLSSPADGAEVSVDDGPFAKAPQVVKVSVGPHKVRARAPGYEDAQVSVTAVAGELMPRPIGLRPKPARLRVAGTAGALVAVDGQALATVPAAAPIEIAPGNHFVAFTMAGHDPFTVRIDAERDTTVDVTGRLSPTRQRITSIATLSAGGAGIVASGVLVGLMLARQSDALSYRGRPSSMPLTSDERDRYNGDISARDDLGRAAAITGAVSALALVTGAVLFAVDKPDAAPPTDERTNKKPSGPEPGSGFEVGLLSVKARILF